MAIRKLHELNDDGTVGVSLDKDELRLEGLIEDGEFRGPEHVEVRRVGDGEWRIRRIP
jgi:hypothetical protein